MSKHFILIALLSMAFTMCTTNDEVVQNEDSAPIDTENQSEIHVEPEQEPGSEKIKRSKVETVQQVESEPFERIKVGSIPDYEVIMQTLEEANLKSICDEQKVDQLDIDLLFMKSAVLPFDQYKTTTLMDDSDRTFLDLFPEQNLKKFYNDARSYLKVLGTLN